MYAIAENEWTRSYGSTPCGGEGGGRGQESVRADFHRSREMIDAVGVVSWARWASRTRAKIRSRLLCYTTLRYGCLGSSHCSDRIRKPVAFILTTLHICRRVMRFGVLPELTTDVARVFHHVWPCGPVSKGIIKPGWYESVARTGYRRLDSNLTCVHAHDCVSAAHLRLVPRAGQVAETVLQGRPVAEIGVGSGSRTTPAL